jgi:hypothetical protein
VVVGSGPCVLRSIVMTVRLFVPFLRRVRPFCAVVIVGSGSCVLGPIVMTVRLLVPFQWRVRPFCAATRSSAARSKKGAKRPQAGQSDQAVQADNKRDGDRTKHSTRSIVISIDSTQHQTQHATAGVREEGGSESSISCATRRTSVSISIRSSSVVRASVSISIRSSSVVRARPHQSARRSTSCEGEDVRWSVKRWRRWCQAARRHGIVSSSGVSLEMNSTRRATARGSIATHLPSLPPAAANSAGSSFPGFFACCKASGEKCAVVRVSMCVRVSEVSL